MTQVWNQLLEILLRGICFSFSYYSPSSFSIFSFFNSLCVPLFSLSITNTHTHTLTLVFSLLVSLQFPECIKLYIWYIQLANTNKKTCQTCHVIKNKQDSRIKIDVYTWCGIIFSVPSTTRILSVVINPVKLRSKKLQSRQYYLHKFIFDFWKTLVGWDLEILTYPYWAGFLICFVT